VLYSRGAKMGHYTRCEVWRFGFEVYGLGILLGVLGFWGSGSRLQGLEFRVQGYGL
jgi:hypothetical protein